jgi:hypothetical protein
MSSIASSRIRDALMHVSHSIKTSVIFAHKTAQSFLNSGYTCFECHILLCSSFGDFEWTRAEHALLLRG